MKRFLIIYCAFPKQGSEEESILRIVENWLINIIKINEEETPKTPSSSSPPCEPSGG